MNFFERVKEKLLKQKQEEIKRIEERMNELNAELSMKEEIVKKMTLEKDTATENKNELEKKALSKKEIEDLQVLYDFTVNYERIRRITDKISHMKSMYDEAIVDVYDEMQDDVLAIEEMNKRKQFCDRLKDLNDEILKICKEDLDNSKEYESTIEEKEPSEKGFFARLFKRNDKITKQSNKEKNEPKDVLKLYKATTEKFKRFYDRFMTLDEEKNEKMDKVFCTKIYSNITYILDLKKRGIKLEKEDEEYLNSVEPVELWKEALRYYNNTEKIKSIIQSFDARFEKFEVLYKSNPELFKIVNLKRILEENKTKIPDLKARRKDISNIDTELSRKRSDVQVKRSQKINLGQKKKKILDQMEKIKNAKSLRELGYKNKEDAKKKLEIETKDYIVIPVLEDISSVLELFSEEKQLKIEADGKIFYTSYLNKVAYGRINSIEKNEKADLVLLIPIDNIRKEYIDNIKSGNIGVYGSVMEIPNIVAFKCTDREFDFAGNNVEIMEANDIYNSVKSYLGDDFAIDYKKEMENYEFLAKIPSISQNEKKLKRDSVQKGLVENISRQVTKDEIVLVNGKPYYLNANDEKDMKDLNKNKDIDEERLKIISESIEECLIEGVYSGAKIDSFYSDLLSEYMKVNKKARAEYIDEENTSVIIQGKKYSIKPSLPAKKEEIVSRYSRKSEDIAYKMMKLANIVNKFAHKLDDNKELQSTLFQTKQDLIEEVINISETNPNIRVKQQFDEKKMAKSVILEIPGYNMIALHIMNTNSSLMKKANLLEYSESEVVNTSTIQYPGVNIELLRTMKRMNSEERTITLLNLDNKTFYKLMIRMGYNYDIINSENERKRFIEDAVSDDKIDELINECNDIERE